MQVHNTHSVCACVCARIHDDMTKKRLYIYIHIHVHIVFIFEKMNQKFTFFLIISVRKNPSALTSIFRRRLFKTNVVCWSTSCDVTKAYCYLSQFGRRGTQWGANPSPALLCKATRALNDE